MLIEFSVANYRSFRERQTLQMTAAPRLSKRDNSFAPGVPGEKLPNLLKVAAVYGANASGKSSLLMAMGVIGAVIKRSPGGKSRKLPASPFRFDKDLADKPSVFEVHFIARGIRYQFRLAMTEERIVEEELFVYPRGKEELLYSRVHKPEGDAYNFGSLFDAEGALRDVWRKLTGPQTLFIFQAVANSSEDFIQLRNPFEWLENGMITVSDNLRPLSDLVRKIPTNEHFSEIMSSFLQEVDIPIVDIRFNPRETETDEGRLPVDGEGDESDEENPFTKKGDTTLTHQSRLGEAKFDFSEESSGTRNLIGFWLPWSMLNKARKEPRYQVLVVDELDSSLHPELVEHLVQKQLQSDTNTQLIFTTHDTHLMSTKLLRRDQFWVTDRNAYGATKLLSIHSVEGREGEDVEKRYFEGRYRGLPIRRRK